MAKKDFAQTAHSVFLQSIGEEPKPPKKDQAKADAGRARMDKLTAAERSAQAKTAAAKRWTKP